MPTREVVGRIPNNSTRLVFFTIGKRKARLPCMEVSQTLEIKRKGMTNAFPPAMPTQIPPAGFEPATTGLGNRCSIP